MPTLRAITHVKRLGQVNGTGAHQAESGKGSMTHSEKSAGDATPVRAEISVRGVVQGVGFRPFVHRLAIHLGLAGCVRNSSGGAEIEIEGQTAQCEPFIGRLKTDLPPGCVIDQISVTWRDPLGVTGFQVSDSDSSGPKGPVGLSDTATCKACLQELFDASNRRYRYPFITCTQCGPRFSLVEQLPFDRPRTTMRAFRACDECEREYHDIGDRRYHSQTNACPDCGPRVWLWDRTGHVVASDEAGLAEAVAAIREGKIVGVKGLGGFHLLVDAHNHEAVKRLRERKQRPEKPLAVMFRNLEQVEQYCATDWGERELMGSPAAPIVLVSRASQRPPGSSGTGELAENVAPGSPYLGCLLPYTPLHHLLLAELGRPVVATSGNLSEEPICTDENEALFRLGEVADLFLIHDRAIARPVDDSVAQVVLGRPLLLRRARGYVPLPVRVTEPLPPILAVGGQMKNTLALAIGNQICLSHHLGDLDSVESTEAFRKALAELPAFYDLEPVALACDAHPGYESTRFAERQPEPLVRVQHHYAHILACMADNDLRGPVLGVAWDGTGYGTDGTIWGGEFLRVDQAVFERVAHLRQFRLPGGDSAAREPKRSAAGLLFEMLGAADFGSVAAVVAPHWGRAWTPTEREGLSTMLSNKLNSPACSSMGRLFDAVASLLGVRHRASFEGQAAMELEFAAAGEEGNTCVSMTLSPEGVLDWSPLIRHLLEQLKGGASLGKLASEFHNGLVEAIVSVAQLHPDVPIVLTGGCFQNRLLLERSVVRLRELAREVYWHRQVPSGDGGLSLGQVIAAGRMLRQD